ncbi:hypothetical protein B0H34DRAFT_739397 [Crassisporium funariophilum]|nr:hypothetical protein B0H34DRAFT_342588 [Crassisporium funariophilum]KAF8147272.1 hypothetical protein B0H34DRAFT_739564 [Crassisporium funariophilum]KAF8147400.1 hypothetical protein B0H34DRAFT_739349 [Crassisporium funariophilum]KAF8147404.1 hypothetical protein B0H34DRAFT_739397 [Crassisporium funariophilum]
MSDSKPEYNIQLQPPPNMQQQYPLNMQQQVPLQQGLPGYIPGTGMQQQYPGTPGSVPTAPIFVYPQPGVMAPNPVAAGQAYRDLLFAQCAQGIHDRKREYGMFGIVTALCFFPLGLICLFVDSSERCSRCGVNLDKK